MAVHLFRPKSIRSDSASDSTNSRNWSDTTGVERDLVRCDSSSMLNRSLRTLTAPLPAHSDEQQECLRSNSAAGGLREYEVSAYSCSRHGRPYRFLRYVSYWRSLSNTQEPSPTNIVPSPAALFATASQARQRSTVATPAASQAGLRSKFLACGR
jgi:hypothetical protein